MQAAWRLVSPSGIVVDANLTTCHLLVQFGETPRGCAGFQLIHHAADPRLLIRFVKPQTTQTILQGHRDQVGEDADGSLPPTLQTIHFGTSAGWTPTWAPA